MTDALLLLVESDPLERERILQALTAVCANPLRLLGVDGPQAALDYLFGQGLYAGRNTRKRPRLVLLGLEDEAGLDLLRNLRLLPQTQSIPVVRLNQPAAPRSVQEAWYKAGANSLVGRTGDDEELLRKMRQVFEFWVTVNEADRHSRV